MSEERENTTGNGSDYGQSISDERLELSLITARITAAQEAQRRSRLAFLAATIVSIIVMISAYNAYFSWHRFLLLDPSPISDNLEISVDAVAQDARNIFPAPAREESGQKATAPTGQSRSGVVTESAESLPGSGSQPGEPKREEASLDGMGEGGQGPVAGKADQELNDGERSDTRTDEEMAWAALPNPDVTYYARQQVIAQWAANEVIAIPILGVRFAVSDAAILGSLLLLFIMTLFAMSMRRENRTIGKLLRATIDSRLEVRELVFHGVVSSMLLTDLGESEIPITRLRGEELGKAPAVRLRTLFIMLTFLPAVAVAFVIFCDLYSIVDLDAVLRWDHRPIYAAIGENAKMWALVALYEFGALFVLFMIVSMSKRVLAFEQGTGMILREYGEQIAKEKSKGEDSTIGLIV